MPDREEVLRMALEAGINVLKENFGDDYDRALVLRNVPLLLEVMWPFIEGYHEVDAIKKFETLFQERFPNYTLTSYGSTSVFDYIVSNVQAAVCDEILCVMADWSQTMQDAQKIPKFRNSTFRRDWDVATSHVSELSSEIRQYRTRGVNGHRTAHTGPTPIGDTNE